MSALMSLNYYGWSSFEIETENGSLFFDPMYRPLFNMEYSDLEDYKNAKIICVSHGHYEHCVDVPSIMNATDATLVSSKTVCDFVARKTKFNGKRSREIVSNEEVSISDFEITAFPWGHRETSLAEFFKLAIVKSELLSILSFACKSRQTPVNAPYFWFYVKCPNNLGIMNCSEGLGELTDTAQVSSLGEKYDTDILIAGTQLNFEDYVAAGATALAPKTVILYHPHTAMFDKFGLESTSPQVFRDKVSQALPGSRVIVAEPGFSIELDALN